LYWLAGSSWEPTKLQDLNLPANIRRADLNFITNKFDKHTDVKDRKLCKNQADGLDCGRHFLGQHD